MVLGWAGFAVSLVVMATYFWAWGLAKNGYYLLTLLGLVSLAVNARAVRLEREEAWLFAAILLFLLVALLSYWHSGMPADSYGQIESHYGKLLSLPPILYLFRHARLNPRCIWALFAVGAIGAGVVALVETQFSYVAYVSGLPVPQHMVRVAGDVNPASFGNISVCLLIVTGIWALRIDRSSIIVTCFACLTLALGAYAVIASQTRGSWLALTVLCLVVLAYYWRRSGPWARWGGIAIALVLAGASYQIPVVNERIDLAAATVEAYVTGDGIDERNGDVAIVHRVEMWRVAWRLFEEHPLLGIGPNRYLAAISAQAEAGLVSPLVAGARHAHNEYLNALATGGVLGLITVVLLLGVSAWIFYRYVRRDNDEVSALGLAGLMVVAAYVIFGLADAPLELKEQIAFYSLAVAMIYGTLRGLEDADPRAAASVGGAAIEPEFRSRASNRSA